MSVLFRFGPTGEGALNAPPEPVHLWNAEARAFLGRSGIARTTALGLHNPHQPLSPAAMDAGYAGQTETECLLIDRWKQAGLLVWS